MEYEGVIIEESLIDTSIIKEVKIITTEVEEVTENENTPWLDKWTMQTVLIPENKIDKYAEKVQIYKEKLFKCVK
jgi:hypothetical protein